jgi:hypothetical protein
MKKVFVLSLIFIFSLSATLYAFDVKGIQPVDPNGVFSTFSTESLQKNKFALSVGAELSNDPDYYRSTFKFAYGLTDSLEIDMTLPYVFGSDYRDNFEDVSIGYKHRFFSEGKYGPSLAYLLAFSMPSGGKDVSTDGRFTAGFIVSKRVGPVNGHLNLLFSKPGSGDYKNEVLFLSGFEFSAAHNFKMLAEISCKKSHFSKKVDSIEGRFGYRFKTTESIYTTFGVGTDFKNRNPESRVFFSVTFVAPAEKKKLKRIYEEE